MFSNNLTMMTDLYELTMMQGYFFEGNEDKVVFDVFYRKNPSGSAYAIILAQSGISSAFFPVG